MIGENICYAINIAVEGFTVWLYLEYLFRAPRRVNLQFASFFLGYFLLYLISGIRSTTLNAIAYTIVNFLLIQFNYRCSKKLAILHTAFLCFIMVVSEIIIALIISIFGYEFSAYTYNINVMVVFAFLSKLLYLMLATIGSRIFVPRNATNEDPHFMILFCSLPLLSSAVAVAIVHLGMNVGITDVIGIMTIMITVTLVIVNLIVLALYNFLRNTNDEYLALQLSIQKEQADVVYYKALQEQFENQKILVHDIKKHLGSIAAIARQYGADEVEKYVSELDATIAPSTHAKLCTDPILNLLLLRFWDECKKHNVTFHCDVREKISSFMDAASITTLYGNLLSNALEAAIDSHNKQIELSITRNVLQSVVVISVINTCTTEPISDGLGGFHTKKKDISIHGIGLRSINRIVKKYHGIATMYYDSERNQFHHIIQFPIPC